MIVKRPLIITAKLKNHLLHILICFLEILLEGENIQVDTYKSNTVCSDLVVSRK